MEWNQALTFGFTVAFLLFAFLQPKALSVFRQFSAVFFRNGRREHLHVYFESDGAVVRTDGLKREPQLVSVSHL